MTTGFVHGVSPHGYYGTIKQVISLDPQLTRWYIQVFMAGGRAINDVAPVRHSLHKVGKMTKHETPIQDRNDGTTIQVPVAPVVTPLIHINIIIINRSIMMFRVRVLLSIVLCLSIGETWAWVSAGTSPRLSTTGLHGVGTAVRRVRDSLLDRERSREDLKIGIAGFYDRSSKLWEDVWGEVSPNNNIATLSHL